MLTPGGDLLQVEEGSLYPALHRMEQPGDPFTLAGVLGIVLAVGSLAALVPAVRASQIEPMRVLREE